MGCEGSIIVGQQPRFRAEFRLGDTLTDPTEVKFIYRRPGDLTSTVMVYGVDPIMRSAAGIYLVDLFVDIAGLWKWRWESMGTVVAASQGTFRVLAEDPIG